MFEQHTGQDQDRLAEIEARLAGATPDDMAWLVTEVKRLQSLLETEQYARRGAEQDAQHYQDEAEALRLQVAQLAEALIRNGGSEMIQTMYLTPAGDYITYDEVLEQERVICPVCNGAVIEDEYAACLECEEGLCMYCWEAGACPCQEGMEELK